MLFGVKLPTCCHILGNGGVLLFSKELTECAKCHDRLDAKVAVLCEVTCKVIGAELILGIVAVFYKVICPCLQNFLVFVRQGAITVGASGGGNCQDRVSAFLNGHLIFELVVAINLTVAKRILSAVVRCKGMRPCLALGVIEDRAHHAAYQLGIVNEIERNGGIGNVERCHAPVREVLLGEEHHLAINLTELVCRNRLAVSKSTEFCVFGGNLFHLFDEFPIKFVANCTQFIRFRNGSFEHGIKITVNSLIVSIHIAVEVLDRFDIIVCEHKYVGQLFRSCAKERNGVEFNGLCQVCVTSPWVNGKLGNAIVEHAKVCIGMHKVQISPIDANVIS